MQWQRDKKVWRSEGIALKLGPWDTFSAENLHDLINLI